MQATVDLSGLDRTDYTYCRFCESIFTRAQHTDGNDYRTCDQCGMFDHIQPYTEFYFYFLLLVYGFSSKKVYLCHSCAHKTFLKTLGLNFIFLIGIPSAIWIKIKSMMNSQHAFEGLDKANALAKKGQHLEAAHYFQQVLVTHPNHPAVLMNRAIGQLNGNDESGAVASLQESLRACNHYLPVLRMPNQ